MDAEPKFIEKAAEGLALAFLNEGEVLYLPVASLDSRVYLRAFYG